MEKLTKEVFAKEIDRLILCFPKSTPKFNQETMAAWYAEINDVDCVRFKKAVTKIIHQDKFFPAISDLRGTSDQFAGAV
jgi:hypothetical protein